MAVTYRLATANDTMQLAELLWERGGEDNSLDPVGREAYIRTCSEHIAGRLNADLFLLGG